MITRDELQAVAELAKFKLNDCELADIAVEFEEIILYFIGEPLRNADELKSGLVCSRPASADASKSGLVRALRGDTVLPSLAQSDVLRGTPDTVGGYVAARNM